MRVKSYSMFDLPFHFSLQAPCPEIPVTRGKVLEIENTSNNMPSIKQLWVSHGFLHLLLLLLREVERGAKQWRCHPAIAPRERPSEDNLSLAVKEASGFVVSEHLAALHRKLRGCH